MIQNKNSTFLETGHHVVIYDTSLGRVCIGVEVPNTGSRFRWTFWSLFFTEQWKPSIILTVLSCWMSQPEHCPHEDQLSFPSWARGHWTCFPSADVCIDNRLKSKTGGAGSSSDRKGVLLPLSRAQSHRVTSEHLRFKWLNELFVDTSAWPNVSNCSCFTPISRPVSIFISTFILSLFLTLSFPHIAAFVLKAQDAHTHAWAYWAHREKIHPNKKKTKQMKQTRLLTELWIWLRKWEHAATSQPPLNCSLPLLLSVPTTTTTVSLFPMESISHN